MTPAAPGPLGSLGDDLRPKIQRGVQLLAGRSFNRAAVAALRLGLPVPPYAPDRALVLETYGRKTGKRRLTPMGCLREGDRLLVVSEHGRRADWVRNALATKEVRLWLAGKPYRAQPQVLDGANPEDLLRRMGNKLHAATIHAMAHEPCVVAFDLTAS